MSPRVDIWTAGQNRCEDRISDPKQRGDEEATGREDLSSVVPILVLSCFIPGLPEKRRRKFAFRDLFKPVWGISLNVFASQRFFPLEKGFPYRTAWRG